MLEKRINCTQKNVRLKGHSLANVKTQENLPYKSEMSDKSLL